MYTIVIWFAILHSFLKVSSPKCFGNHCSTFREYIKHNSVRPTAEHSTTVMYVLPIALNLELSTVSRMGRYGKFKFGDYCRTGYDSMKSGRSLPTF